MRVILDTNILVSALMVDSGAIGAIYKAWMEGRFTLLVSREQLVELKKTLAKPTLAARIRPHQAGRLVNDLRRLSEVIGPLPPLKRSPDPEDDYGLATAETGNADFLVTGDKSGLLALKRHHRARIVSARNFANLIA